MKNILIPLLFLLGIQHQYKSCEYYDPDKDYFNLFSQETITDQAYYPFLLTYSNHFYQKTNTIKLQDENIEAWQRYFKNELTYSETDALLKVIDIKHLYNIKKGKLTHQLFKKLGTPFYKKYKEGLDYIIEAKYLQPYMQFKSTESSYSFYQNENTKNADDINYEKNHKALISLYKAAKNKEIKLRYGYQIVRFNHYTGRYKKAIETFNKYVQPLKYDTPIYWYALDQMAGAERALGQKSKANYHFFQVFMHSRNRKQSAFVSMRLSNDGDFKNLLKQTKSKKEKNFAYFLLAYNSFNNEIPIIEYIYSNDENSDLTKVLVARAMNQLERNYLPYYASCHNENCKDKTNRLPILHNQNESSKDINTYSKDLEKFIIKAKNKTNDDFWKITLAYIKFLRGEHTECEKTLTQIKTKNQLYKNQIERIQLINDIVSQPKIDSDFENTILTKYPTLFNFNKEKRDPWEYETGTKGFIKDILANRYFIQGEHGKSFLMNNHLSNLQFSPNSKLVNEVETFLNKKNKTNFEKSIIYNQTKDIGNINSFFAVIHGDIAMRNGNFNNAEKYYKNATKFKGIFRTDWDGNQLDYEKGEYNGFDNISDLVFGHNTIESFNSPESVSLTYDYNNDFPFIKKNMNKLELAQTIQQLQKIAKNKNTTAAKANQLIGNALYNTSILGYYRHYFVMDINNQNGPKFHFINQESPLYKYYYKNFGYSSSVDPSNFDLVIHYYKKALQRTKEKEQKARILFQMASAEQGKYYQWEATLPNIEWNENWEQKEMERNKLSKSKKNTEFRKYFKILKSKYSETKTVESLKNSCSYFNYFMM